MNEHKKELIKQAGFDIEVDRINAGRCPFCNEISTGFRNDISVREYKISGLCQNCQDNMFGKD